MSAVPAVERAIVDAFSRAKATLEAAQGEIKDFFAELKEREQVLEMKEAALVADRLELYESMKQLDGERCELYG